MAADISASDMGAADAKDASAVVMAPARMVAFMVDFIDIVLFSRSRLHGPPDRRARNG
jgi:hypothetical protein